MSWKMWRITGIPQSRRYMMSSRRRRSQGRQIAGDGIVGALVRSALVVWDRLVDVNYMIRRISFSIDLDVKRIHQLRWPAKMLLFLHTGIRLPPWPIRTLNNFPTFDTDPLHFDIAGVHSYHIACNASAVHRAKSSEVQKHVLLPQNLEIPYLESTRHHANL